MKRRFTLLLVVVLALIGAGAAGSAIRAAVTPRGQSASFVGDRAHWSCFNGTEITCLSGDAKPYVTLSKSGLVVRVVNLKPACAKRILRPSPDPSDAAMKPYYEYTYTFKPFGCR